MRLSFLLAFMLSLSGMIQAQTTQVRGTVLDSETKTPISDANITSQGFGATTDSTGQFSIDLPSGNVKLIISHIAYFPDTLNLVLSGERQEIQVELDFAVNLIDDVTVTDERDRFQGITALDPKMIGQIAMVNDGVESLIKTLPGVSSNNELSSQYSVRGGNFDENLVYVNGIQIRRPFLVRSGQQEGLSFINADMVANVQFSAGGFQARYGDKMSSVLDVTYKQPRKNLRTLRFSLLGQSATVEGITKDYRLSYIMSFRQRSNRNLLSTLDTDADYNANFADFQSYITYYINDDWDISFLGNFARNRYNVIPQTRQTDFGTISAALRLTVFFEGQEVDAFDAYTGAISSTYRPHKDLSLQFIGSAYAGNEKETFDILGQYLLGDLDNNLGSESFGEVVSNRGIGGFLNHARNRLNSRNYTFSHRGLYTSDQGDWRWGASVEREEIEDQLWEWTLIDSAFYSTPQSSAGNPFELYELIRGNASLESYRFKAYAEWENEVEWLEKEFFLNLGLRSHTWSLNSQTVISPRISIGHKPDWEKDVVFRFATGLYYQMPIYRELRALDGSLNKDIRAQRSLHLVGGMDYEFKAWNRPFKFTGEAYYKDLDNLIPYEIQNVRIRYYAENMAKGFATGLDFKVNGEFVKGIESWASLSVMTIQEDLEGDQKLDQDSNMVAVGYIPRPTDQRVNFSIFFQDYLPNNPSTQVNLTLVFGTGLPFGPPQTQRHQQTLRMPPYRRVDIGFIKILRSEEIESKFKPLNHFESAFLSLEVFNLLQIRNTISYLWVQDVNGAQFAVPNFLTSRLVNLKLALKF